MKRSTSILVGLSLALTLILSSCQLTELDEAASTMPMEDEPELNPQGLPSSEAEFQTLFYGDSERSWETISFTISGIDGLQGCRLDDNMRINADGTYQYDGGSELCGAEDTQQGRSGTWSINAALDRLTFDEGTERAYTANLDALIQDTLVVSGSYIGLEIRGIYVVK